MTFWLDSSCQDEHTQMEMSEEERGDVCANMSSLMQGNQEDDDFLVRLLVSVSQHEHTQMEMLEEERDEVCANM